MEVRVATAKDSAEITRLSIELGYVSSAREIEARLGILAKSDTHFVAVAVGEGPRILGWIAAEERLVLESGERTEIVGIVVDPEFRQLSVGRSLIDEVERWTLARGGNSIVVWSDVVRNESHPFFQRIGFARSKSQHVYVKDLWRDGERNS